LPGSKYAYFKELDAWTEYWDIYHPETGGRYYFGDGEQPGLLAAFRPTPFCYRDPVFDSPWHWNGSSSRRVARTSSRFAITASSAHIPNKNR